MRVRLDSALRPLKHQRLGALDIDLDQAAIADYVKSLPPVDGPPRPAKKAAD